LQKIPRIVVQNFKFLLFQIALIVDRRDISHLVEVFEVADHEFSAKSQLLFGVSDVYEAIFFDDCVEAFDR